MNLLEDNEKLSIVLMLHSKSDIQRFLSTLSTEHFDNPYCGLSYGIIKEYYLKYDKIITVKNFVIISQNEKIDNKFISELLTIYKTIKDEPLDYYCDTVATFLRTKILKQAVNDSYGLISNGRENEIEAHIRTALASSAEFNYGLNYYDDINRRYSNVENRYKTGFKQLDVMLGGGWQKKCAYGIMGASGYGKSIFLTNFAIAQSLMGRNVIMFSLELSEEIIASRIDSLLLRKHFDIGKINELSDKLVKIKTTLLGGKNNFFIKEMPVGYTHMGHLINYVDNLRSKMNFHPDVIVMDYLNIVEPIHKASAQSRHEKIGMATSEFRGWMVADNMIGLTAMQQRRMSKDQNRDDVDEMEVGDAYELVRTLDGLFAIIQTPQDKMAIQPKLHLKSLKNRQGPTGRRITFDIYYEQMRLEEQLVIK